MRYFAIVLFLGLWHNILAGGLENNVVLSDLEQRLVRLEGRQFSESQDLEHRMLQMEVQLGTQQGDEKFISIQLEAKPTQKPPSGELTLVERLEKIEKNWEKDLAKKLAKFSAKHDNLAERLSVFEKQVREQRDNAKISEIVEQITQKGNVPSDLNFLSKFQKIGEKYYIIEHEKVATWNEAFNKCTMLHGVLVSLQNEEEWQAIKEHLESDKSYWVDINDILDEGDYMSGLTGRKAPFLKWESREPNHLNSIEDCVELRRDYNHYMNDIQCSEKNSYICELKLPTV